MKQIMVGILALAVLIANAAAAEEFVDKRFYEKMNPMSGRGSWVQVTPDSVIEDNLRSYWIQGVIPGEDVIWAEEVETKCTLLENKIGYVKFKCPSNYPQGGIVELWILGKYEYEPCSLRVKYMNDGSGGHYWIPDGSRDDSSFDPTKPFSYDNNNAYKGCKEDISN